MMIMLVIATPISNFFIIDMFHIKSFLICIIVNEPLISFMAVGMILFYPSTLENQIIFSHIQMNIFPYIILLLY